MLVGYSLRVTTTASLAPLTKNSSSFVTVGCFAIFIINLERSIPQVGSVCMGNSMTSDGVDVSAFYSCCSFGIHNLVHDGRGIF